jgi:hypothetical protein
LLLAQGDLDEAARWTVEAGLGEDDEPDYAREPGHLVLARVLLAQDRPARALTLLDRLHATATAQHGSYGGPCAASAVPYGIFTATWRRRRNPSGWPAGNQCHDPVLWRGSFRLMATG